MKRFKVKNFWLILSVVLLIIVLRHLIIGYKNTIELTHPTPQTHTYRDVNDIENNLAYEEVLEITDFIKTPSRSERNLYNYNKTLSDSISVLRTLPDTRDLICSKLSHNIPQKNCQVSVIIAYHNEARSTLLRTLLSIIARTPSQYLKEIILLDDCSEDIDLLSKLRTLDAITRGTHQIKMHRNTRRQGVIASRNLGAKLAAGHYLLFLDSHCEVNVGWLEPLLARITTSRDDSIAVSPVLDSIDAVTFKYRATLKHLMGGFDWNLHFHWMHATRDEVDNVSSKAFKSPAFAGGIFMISRNWFFKLNGFNPLLETLKLILPQVTLHNTMLNGFKTKRKVTLIYKGDKEGTTERRLKIWGGESIEMSIKLWLCGGQIEIVPCSRVGHIFRKQHPFDFPHGDDGQTTYLRNSKVIAESWLDDYKYFFYASKPAAKNISLSLSSRELNKLKPDLQCRPFAWYLRTIFKELKLPNDDYVAYGQLSSSTLCLQIRSSNDAAGVQQLTNTPLCIGLYMGSCYDSDVTHWHLDRYSGQLLSSSGACLNVINQERDRSREVGNLLAAPLQFSNVSLQYCRSTGDSQRWLRFGGRLIHAATRLCLDNPLGDIVAVSLCRHMAPTQLFRFSTEIQKI